MKPIAFLLRYTEDYAGAAMQEVLSGTETFTRSPSERGDNDPGVRTLSPLPREALANCYVDGRRRDRKERGEPLP
jgi:hypothetical protein